MTENQPAIVIPRYHLPDEWSGKGACPVCRTPGQLSVQHQDVTPDRMLCGACGTAFEVETAGARIRLAAAPPALAQHTADLVNAWLTPAELIVLVEQAAPGSPFEPVASAPAPVVVTAAKTPTTPLAPKSNALAAGEPEPGSEDWFASLAAVIGGQLPIKPPPNTVLADELERALLNRPAPAPEQAAPAPAAAAIETPAVAPELVMTPAPMAAVASTLAAPAPEPPMPVSEPAPAPLPPTAPKSATDVLAEAIAERAAVSAPAAALVETPVAEPAPSPVAPPTMAAPPPTPPAAAMAPETVAALAFEPASVEAMALMLAADTPDPADTGHVIQPSATRRELAERAWRLHELGNSLASIRGALESSGGAPDDVGIIMSKLVALEQARHERFRRTLRNGIIAGVSILVVLVVIAIVLGSLKPAAGPAAAATLSLSGTPGVGSASPGGTPVPTEPAQPAYNPIIALINQIIPGDVKLANGPTPTPAPTSAVLGALFPATATATLSAEGKATQAARESGLPAWVATLVPSGLTVINVPTPSIENSGPPNSPCPSTVDQASALFGGPAADWSFSHDQQGWIFVLPASPTSIHVPANMTAGYLVIGASLEMRSAVGPATLHNVNFVAVSCQ